MKIVDRYIILSYINTTIFALGALLSVMYIVDMLERLDKFMDANATFPDIVEFYVVSMPAMTQLLIPIAMLLGGLFSVGRLASTNEIVALKSSGYSLYRFMVPFLIVGIVASGFQFWFNGWVVPRANERKVDLERTILNKSRTGYSMFNLAFRESPVMNVTIEFFDVSKREARGTVVEEFTSVLSPRLLRRTEAPVMLWDTVEKRWVLPHALIREYHDGRIHRYRSENLSVAFSVRPDQIGRLQKTTDEQTNDEFLEYIETLERGGRDTSALRIELASRQAFPFANFVVLLLAIPFASVRRPGGVAVNVGMAMAVTITYIALSKIIGAVGISADIPQETVAWGANLLFVCIGILILVRTRT